MDERARGSTTGVAALLPYAAEPRPGLVSAGQPGPAHWAAIAARGIEAVVDLREAWEPRGHAEEDAVVAAGLRYENVPFGHGAIADATFDRVRAVMREVGASPVVVHCASANRVGAALIPWWVLDQGLSEEEALQTAVDAGLRSRALAMVALDYVRRKRSEQEEAA